jgi:ribose-phosphate pyrophosphokinase
MIVLGRDGFSERLAKETGSEFVRIESKIFPDGESYFRVSEPEKVSGEKAILVVRGESSKLDQNRILTESILLLDKLKEIKAKKICLVLPYIPYARQDKEFLKGETVSIKTIRNLLKEKCDLLVNVTSHDFRKEGWIDRKTYNLDATGSIAEFLKKKKLKDPIVIAPDIGVSESVEKLAKQIGGNSIGFEKERDRKTGKIRISGKIPNLRGQELVIYDDMVSTGGTIYNILKLAKKTEAGKIICVSVHVISVLNEKFRKNSIDLIRDECEFLATDTIDSEVSRVSVIPQLARTLLKIF